MTILSTLPAVFGALYGQMMWDHDNGGGWMWLWGTIMFVVLVAAIVIGAVLIVRGTRPPESAQGDRARDILAERYARGEISTEEYEERIKILR